MSVSNAYNSRLYNTFFLSLIYVKDSGKSIHDGHPFQSLIDLNRCGLALMEIITLPDLRYHCSLLSF